MSGITVLVFLVHCTVDVLVCETVPTDRMRYASMETCRSELTRLLTDKRKAKGTDVWMGKCVYRLASADPRRTRRAIASRETRVQKFARIKR